MNIFDILTRIRQLEQDWDPGTLQVLVQDLHTLSLTELRALVALLQEAAQ